MMKRSALKTRHRVAFLATTAAICLIAAASPAQAQSHAANDSNAVPNPATSSHKPLSTNAFLDTLGVNTHLDFGATIVPAYADLPTVEKAIDYLGVKNLRDSAQGPDCAPNWAAVANATGTKFDDFIGEDSPYGMYFDLGCMPGLANQHILNYVEGGNEEDDAYPASLGNNLTITTELQKSLYTVAQSLGLPTINMSFGAGWTADNDWHGDYDKVGDLSPYADYANAHDYPVPGATADTTIQQLNDDAHLAAASRPVMVTEFGYNTSVTDSATAAKGTLDAALDATKDGDTKLYYYALFDDTSGDFGLMNTDATPKPAGLALHNLTTLLSSGQAHGKVQSTALDYTLTGQESADNDLLLQGPDGSYWLALWNESAAAHKVTLGLGCTAQRITTFDPLTGTTAIASTSQADNVEVTIPDHPVLVHIEQPGAAGRC